MILMNTTFDCWETFWLLFYDGYLEFDGLLYILVCAGPGKGVIELLSFTNTAGSNPNFSVERQPSVQNALFQGLHRSWHKHVDILVRTAVITLCTYYVTRHSFGFIEPREGFASVDSDP